MKKLYLLMIILSCSCSSNKPDIQNNIDLGNEAVPAVSEEEIDNKDEIIEKLHGSWVHADDSLASVEIVNGTWTFKYAGSEIEEGDIYKIEITDSLPDYVNEKSISGFMLLIKEDDTMHYEILGLDDAQLSLMYYPRGNTHLYKKIK